MSETQRRVTGSFQAVDENGKEYTVTEYTKFEHTTTLETAEGEESEGVKEYEAGSGVPLKRTGKTEFESLVDGAKFRVAGEQTESLEMRICESIKERRLLQFAYDDLTRVVEPHLLGRKTSGNVVLSAYLVDGYSESDDEPYWRNFVVDEIEFMVVLDRTFEGAREGYNPDDKTMTEIFCRL